MVRCTESILNCTSTGDNRFAPRNGRGIVSLVPRRRNVRSVNNAVHLNTCPYIVGPSSLVTGTCNRRRVSRHRHRHCRFGGSFERRVRGTNVGVANASPGKLLIRTIRIPSGHFFITIRCRPRFGSHPGHTRPLFERFVGTSLRGWLVFPLGFRVWEASFGRSWRGF